MVARTPKIYDPEFYNLLESLVHFVGAIVPENQQHRLARGNPKAEVL